MAEECCMQGELESGFTDEEMKEKIAFLTDYLLEESGRQRAVAPNASFEELWRQFRALVNVREPRQASESFLAVQDELLRELIRRKGITEPEDLPPVGADGRIRLWRGDITALATDAIVNAANSKMLGCWVPGHHCIDNAIHTFAGVQLRAECAQIMRAQGFDEPTGKAKVTKAYNLPSRWIVHTVGPIANGRPSDEHRRELASCYESCLEAAQERGFSSIGFCCISTGAFGFPQDEAAAIASRTVTRWLDGQPGNAPTVVFNVFTDQDERLYRNLLGAQR